ncbi:unnamed protein product, partial [Enterobius vermicularis]|uniref:DUF148 domain-containing protein n=1 Tax=Enterobius vermicularis TaxID=51028 RepID=A0A0N4UU65_ENTVE
MNKFKKEVGEISGGSSKQGANDLQKSMDNTYEEIEAVVSENTRNLQKVLDIFKKYKEHYLDTLKEKVKEGDSVIQIIQLRKNTELNVLKSLEQELIQMGLGPSAKSWIQEMKTVEGKWWMADDPDLVMIAKK